MHGVTSSRERDASEQFAAFVLAEGPRLLRFATLLTGSRTDAEDLVQTALTATYARWSHVADRDPGAYVRRAIVNARTSAWRRTRRATPVAELPELAGPDAFAPSDDRAALRAALAGLTRPQRTVLLLRHLEGWDYGEIADALSLPRATVRSHHARGLARLREQLGEQLGPTPTPLVSGARP